MTVQANHEEVAESLRRAARRFATGVTVVAAADGHGVHAMTANSFVSLSLRPPLVGVAVQVGGRLRPLTERVLHFGISVLSESQRDYADHYAWRERNGASPDLAFSMTGDPSSVPLISECVAYFVCELRSVHPVGDHELIVGSVLECGACCPARAPLVFVDGRFRSGR